MNAFRTASLLFALSMSQLPAVLHAQDIVNAAPSVGTLAGGGIQASPLVRYLAATLHLSPARTKVVQLAVQKHQRRTRTPELLASYLYDVLTLEEYDHFLSLQDERSTPSSPSLAHR